MFELKPYRKNDYDLTYNPFKELETFERSFFNDPFFNNFFTRGSLASFRTDIIDKNDSYLLEAELPGFDKKDISLNISGDTLTIEAEHRDEHKEKTKKDGYMHIERYSGHYSRSFDVSEIDTDNIKAKYENGILTLTLPKKEPTVPEARRLEIE